MHINMGSGDTMVSLNGMNITMKGGDLYVNGVLYGPTDGSASPSGTGVVKNKLELDRNGQVNGDIHGDLEIRGSNIQVTITGAVRGSVRCDGNLTCGVVGGSANSNGNLRADTVGGSANAGNDIHAGKVGGSANAGRDIHKKA